MSPKRDPCKLDACTFSRSTHRMLCIFSVWGLRAPFDAFAMRGCGAARPPAEARHISPFPQHCLSSCLRACVSACLTPILPSSLSSFLRVGRRGAHRARRLIPAHESQVDGRAVFYGFVDAHECGGGCEAVARPPWASADEFPLTAAGLRQSRPAFG